MRHDRPCSPSPSTSRCPSSSGAMTRGSRSPSSRPSPLRSLSPSPPGHQGEEVPDEGKRIMPEMIVLGINETHCATAAILRDGRIVGCASEERFTRLKNDAGYPRLAIDALRAELPHALHQRALA